MRDIIIAGWWAGYFQPKRVLRISEAHFRSYFDSGLFILGGIRNV